MRRAGPGLGVAGRRARRFHADGHEPKRGDVIAFVPGPSAARTCGTPRDRVLLKRVGGVPGDEVVVAGGATYVNGAARTVEGETPPDRARRFPRVPPGRLLVFGDDRPDSCDSMWFASDPFVAMDDVVGRVEGIYAPRARIGLVRRGGGIEPVAARDEASRARFDVLIRAGHSYEALTTPLGSLRSCASRAPCRPDLPALTRSAARRVRAEARRAAGSRRRPATAASAGR